jgi:ribosomal protein S18 acetylase RimI-like enzyme/anti-sigma regulatory factor (Ser/Thr protein kinase)
MSGIVVAEASEADLEQVAQLLLEAFDEHLAVFPPELARNYCAELSDVRSRLADSQLIVARHGRDLIGSVTFLPDAGGDGHPWPPGGSVLRLLAVRPERRHQGVGEVLTLECIERARARGSTFLGLHTAPFMLAARRLYERLGFQRCAEHDFDATRYYGRSEEAGREDHQALSGLAYCLPLQQPSPEAPQGRPTKVTREALPSGPASAALARRVVRNACVEAGVDADAAVLCTSELVTNDLLHGDPPFDLEVSVDKGRVRVAVFDHGAGIVALRDPLSDTAATGRGLEIVAALSSSWNVTPTDEGKAVWFVLSAKD